MTGGYTLETLEQRRARNHAYAKRYMSRILDATRRAVARKQRDTVQQCARAAISADPRRAALGPWDRAVLEAVAALGEYATDARLLARLRRQGRASLSPEALGRALARLLARGLVTVESRDERGQSVRVWRGAPEDA